ncbi:lipopolysaccharide kinase InaA family protein [Thiomicrolovo sp. ZZH C-3]
MSVRYTIHPDYAEFETELLSVEAQFSSSDESIHKARNELRIVPMHGIKTVIKAFKVPHLLNRFVYAYLRDSKAKKSYHNGVRLQDLDVPTPQPIGYIEFFERGLFAQSFFISKYEPYDFTIREVLHHEVEDVEAILRAFTTFTCSLHEKGVWHEDYSPGNILIRKENGAYTFMLVDINRMQFRPIGPLEGLKNFSKLWAQPDDLALMGRVYAELRGIDEALAVKAIAAFDRKTKAVVNFKKRLKGKK